MELFVKMFIRSILFILFLFLNLNQITDTLFVSLGDYPDHKQYGINQDDCGVGGLQEVYKIERLGKCFHKNSGNTTVTVNHHNLTTGVVSNRIFQGREALAGDSPWTVYLIIGFGEPKKHTNPVASVHPETVIVFTRFCNGVLITMQWVLTSYACLARTRTEYEVLTLGVMSPNRNVRKNVTIIWEKGKVMNAHIYTTTDYPGHTPILGLFKLDQPFDLEISERLTYLVNNVCLPQHSAALNQNEEYAVFTGWGATDPSHQEPERLQIAPIRLNPAKDCIPGFHQLCSKASDTQHMEPEPCGGDWGGPLIQYSNEKIPRAILVGNLRTADQGGSNSCPSNGTSYYYPTSKYVNWILETIKTK